jgi:catechol 2,3-dioxygenase-like lactoylglutathione lyase family enzyme
MTSKPPAGAITQHPVVQLCFLVDDLDTAIEQWTAVMGAGPFFLIPHAHLENVTFRGAPLDYDHSIAVGQWGTMQIELHQAHSDTPSPARELFEPGRTGLLQVSWYVDDVDDEIARMEGLGYPEMFTADAEGGLRASWFDTRSLIDTYVEVYEEPPAAPASDAIARASVGWNGERPARAMAEIAEFMDEAGAAELGATGAITQYPIVQLCFLVNDLDAAIDDWVRVMGAGPFFVMRHVDLASVTYHGEESTYDHSAALGQWGTMQVELHQQHCDTPSPAKDLFAPGETGLLQVTWLVDDVDAEIARMEDLGFPTVWTCEAEGGVLKTAWFDTRSLLDTYVEVYPKAFAAPAYAAIARAAEGWDGSRPVREMADVAEFLSA